MKLLTHEIDGELAANAVSPLHFALQEAANAANEIKGVERGKHLRVTVEVIDELTSFDPETEQRA
jgi:hypothetical protein